MVSRQETARPLMTPGEIMQLPPTDEIVMVAGTPPIRVTKARYYEDARFQERILTPPDLSTAPLAPSPSADDWSGRVVAAEDRSAMDAGNEVGGDPANAGIRREPELPSQEEIVAPPPSPEQEFEFLDDEPDVDAAKARAMRQRMRMVARQVAFWAVVVTMVAALIFGQLFAALVLDALGAFGLQIREISPTRLLAVGFVALGLVLSRF